MNRGLFSFETQRSHLSSAGAITLFSPAKVTLFLRVLSKRADGFHEIAVLNQAVSLGDLLHVETSEEDRLITTSAHAPSAEENLTLKAAELFRKKSGIAIFAHFHLFKRIPLYSGLGGGASNAATALWALNLLSGKPVPPALLAEWGAKLSKDIPFFFGRGLSYCTAAGESVKPVSILKKENYWIAKPLRKSFPTTEVYSKCIPEELSPRDPEYALKSFLDGKNNYFNDLEEAAFSLDPSLLECRESLQAAKFDEVCMIGTGNCFLCTGTPSTISIDGLQLFKVSSLQRREEHWYESPFSATV